MCCSSLKYSPNYYLSSSPKNFYTRQINTTTCIIKLVSTTNTTMLSTIRKFSLTIDTMMHRQPSKGSGTGFGASVFEERYRLLVGQYASESIIRAIALALNSHGIFHSGRCNSLIAPIIRQNVSTT